MRSNKYIYIGLVSSVIALASITSAQQESQYALLRKPVFKSPLIWKLTRSVTDSLWGVDLFYGPRSIAQSYVISPGLDYYSADGFILDQFWDRIIYTEALDDWIRAYGNHGAGAGRFLWPQSIDVLAPCDQTYYSYYYFIYIADTENNRIVKLKYDWRMNNQTITYDGEIIGELDRPFDIDLHNNGDFWPGSNDYLWVLDRSGGIKRVTPDGIIHSTYGDTGCAYQTGAFCRPSAVVCGRNAFLSAPYDRGGNDNDIYVADVGNQRIVRLQKSSDGEALTWLWTTPTTAGISDLEVDSWGQLWATDHDAGTVVKYTKDLFPLCTFGARGSGPNQFMDPVSISNTGGYLGCGNMFVGEAWTDSTGGQYYATGTDLLDYYITSTPDERWQYIHYVLVDPSVTIIWIIDLQSKVVRTLHHGMEMSGDCFHVWDGTDDSGVALPAGYYSVIVSDTGSYIDTETGLPSNVITKGAWVFHQYNPMPTYTPGDVNNDGSVDVGDAVYLVTYIFKGGPAPVPLECVGDVNDDGLVNIGDSIYIMNFIFKGGAAPLDGCQ